MKKTNFIKVLTMLGIVILLGATSCTKEKDPIEPATLLSSFADSVTGNWTATTIAVLTGVKSLSGGLVPSDTLVYHKDSVTITKINDSNVSLANTSVNGFFDALSDYIDSFGFMSTSIILTADDLRRFYNDSMNQVVLPLSQTTIGAPLPYGLGTKDSILGALYIKCTNVQSLYYNSKLFSFRATFSLNIKLDQLLVGGTANAPIFPGTWANPNLALLFSIVTQANPTWLAKPPASRGSVSAMLTGGGVYTTTYQRR